MLRRTKRIVCVTVSYADKMYRAFNKQKVFVVENSKQMSEIAAELRIKHDLPSCRFFVQTYRVML